MKTSLIVACFLGALSFSEVQAIRSRFEIVSSGPSSYDPIRAAKESPVEQAASAAKKAGVDLKEEDEVKEAIKRDAPVELKEAEAAEVRHQGVQKEVTARIEREQQIKVGAAAKAKSTPEEREAELKRVIKERVEAAKKASDAAKAADDAQTAAQKIQDTLRGKEIVEHNKRLVKAVEDETARERAAEEKARAANRAKAPKSAEAWTANMPETYLKGYLGTGEENMDQDNEDADSEEEDEDVDDEESEDDEEADGEGAGDKKKPANAEALQVEDAAEDEDEEDEEDDSEDEEDDEDADEEEEQGQEEGDGDAAADTKGQAAKEKKQ